MNTPTQTPAAPAANPAKGPVTYSSIPYPASAKDKGKDKDKDKDITAVPPTTPAKGNDEVMSTPAKQS